MGYNTNYTMRVYTDNPDTYMNVLFTLERKQILPYAVYDAGYLDDTSEEEPFFELPPSDGVHWYDHNDDMLSLSREFPEIRFYLHGEGEESGDLWDAWYLNGKTQFCPAEIIYPPFDPEQLE